MGVWPSKEVYQSIPEKDLDKPLIKWQVATSHNSFMRNAQHLAPALSENVAQSIRSGARYVMLDVYRICDKLMVAHGDGKSIVTTFPVPLGECLDVILKEAFAYTQDPLLLNFELCLDKSFHEEISTLAQNKLGSSLLKKEDLPTKTVTDLDTGETKEIPLTLWETPIGSLKSKIIVVGTTLSIDMSGSGVYRNLSSNTFLDEQKKGTLDTTTKYITTWQSDNLGAAFGLNYNPEPFLQAGAQAVSMNVLVDDEAMAFYKGWFRGSGFILKIDPPPKEEPTPVKTHIPAIRTRPLPQRTVNRGQQANKLRR